MCNSKVKSCVCVPRTSKLRHTCVMIGRLKKVVLWVTYIHTYTYYASSSSAHMFCVGKMEQCTVHSAPDYLFVLSTINYVFTINEAIKYKLTAVITVSKLIIYYGRQCEKTVTKKWCVGIKHQRVYYNLTPV